MKSIVDRTIVPILPNPNDTPSRRQGVSMDLERKHRLYGTCLLASATKLLHLNASTYATSCVIFHRFYHRVSLTQHCVWSAAMACLLLAAKVEDGPQQRTIRHIVLVFDHLYRKRRGCLTGHAHQDILPMNKIGPVWDEWFNIIVKTEHRVLAELGFTLYWIPDAHPHKFLWEVLKILLQLQAETQHHILAQRAWNYCNDASRLDLCVRYDSEVITCAAIHLAAVDLKLQLPMQPKPWWEHFLRSSQDLSTAANAILGLAEYERNSPSHKDFLPSLIPGGSFNDRDSFLWECRVID